jgi:hypothetical protein
VQLNEQNLRDSFRVDPERDEPVILLLENQLVRVFNISAGGFSCQADRHEIGMRYRLRLNLPDVQQNIDTTAELLHRDENGTAHFAFRTLNENQQAQLHYYVLQRQLRGIRSQRELR